MTTSPIVYLDWAATAPPDADVLREVEDTATRFFGNPSSLHPAGLEAQERLDRDRRVLAECLGCGREELYFTSGGTESNNLALGSLLFSRLEGRSKPPRLVLSSIEHPSLHLPATRMNRFGIPAVLVPPERDGVVDPDRIVGLLSPDVRFVALMLVNNETGAIQPVAAAARGIAEYARKIGRRIHLHTDAVQAFGKIPLDLDDVDSASISAHKLQGPRGVGLLFLSRTATLNPIYGGGEQERGLRPGTENLPGISGFALAARKSRDSLADRLTRTRSMTGRLVEELIRIGGGVILPEARLDSPERFSPYILSAAFPPIPGEVLVRVLGEKGICVSTGAACASRKKDRDRVLKGMGIAPGVAFSAIRISLGPTTTREHCERLVDVLRSEVPALRRLAG